MIKVTTQGPIGEEFEDWRKRAEKARDKLIKNWKETGEISNLNSNVWQDFKIIFLNDLFDEKCAYCEGQPTAHFTLHVEHYRPKKGVTERIEEDDPIKRESIEHPGYFWLAYEWYNLILSCPDCNTKHRSHPLDDSESHPGKLNEFRVQGRRIQKPSENPESWQNELKEEKPILLHPYDEDEDADPAKHITFEANGVPYPVGGSQRGRETIEVCNLDRHRLVKDRLGEREKAYNRISRACNSKGDENEPLFGKDEQYSAWMNQCVTFKMFEILNRQGISVKLCR